MHQAQWSPERPLPPPVSWLLRATMRSPLRSPAQVEGTQGFLPQPEKKFSSCHGSYAISPADFFASRRARFSAFFRSRAASCSLYSFCFLGLKTPINTSSRMAQTLSTLNWRRYADRKWESSVKPCSFHHFRASLSLCFLAGVISPSIRAFRLRHQSYRSRYPARLPHPPVNLRPTHPTVRQSDP